MQVAVFEGGSFLKEKKSLPTLTKPLSLAISTYSNCSLFFTHTHCLSICLSVYLSVCLSVCLFFLSLSFSPSLPYSDEEKHTSPTHVT